MHKNETKKNGVAGDKVSLEQNYDVEEPKLLQTLLHTSIRTDAVGGG